MTQQNVANCLFRLFAVEKVKRGVDSIRGNVTNELWKMIMKSEVLQEEIWTAAVEEKLQVGHTYANIVKVLMKHSVYFFIFLYLNFLGV